MFVSSRMVLGSRLLLCLWLLARTALLALASPVVNQDGSDVPDGKRGEAMVAKLAHEVSAKLLFSR